MGAGPTLIIRAMLVQRVQQQFLVNADLTYQCADSLAVPVEAAIAAVLATVTGGGKVLACGSGAGAWLAQLLVSRFLGHFERERPALPAVALGAMEPLLVCGDAGSPSEHPLARQVRALGQSDDLLLVLCDGAQASAWSSVVAAAHDRDMTVLALTGGNGPLSRALRDTDVQVNVAHPRSARVNELHHLVLNCICDGVDVQLLGDATELETAE